MANAQKIFLNILGIFFLVYGVFAIDYAVYRGKPSWAFWICYLGLIIIGVGVLSRSSKLVISQLYILTIPLVVWLTDFFSRIVTGSHWFGTTTYFFDDLLLPARIISLEHFFLLPLGYLALWLIGGRIRGAWIISVIEVTLIYLVVKFFTDPAQNVNCVFISCFPYVPTDFWYPSRWFIIIFGMIFIVWLIVQIGLYLTRKIKYTAR